jgi:hypothetical protein
VRFPVDQNSARFRGVFVENGRDLSEAAKSAHSRGSETHTNNAHRWRDLSPHIKLDMVTQPGDLRSLRCIVRLHVSQGVKLEGREADKSRGH